MRIFVLEAVLLLVFCHSAVARISPDDYKRAADFFNEEQYDDAIAVLKASLDEDPNQAGIYNLIGIIYLKQNQSVQSAIGSFEQAIEIDPNFAEAYFNLASTYAGTANRPELAAKYFKKTLEVDPKYVKAYFGLGWFTLVNLENPEKAVEYFQKATASFPGFAEAFYGLGLAYIQMGKAPLALQPVSKLRTLGREDLASYLESVLRGNKVSDTLQNEANNNTLPGDMLPAGQENADSLLEAGGGTPGAGLSESGNSSENANPFQLN